MELIAICKIILICCIGGMTFIFLRVLPLFPEFKLKPVSEEKKISFRFKTKVGAIRKKGAGRLRQSEKKFVYKIKILVLKADNSLTSYLRKAREKEIHLEKIHFSRKKKAEKAVELKKILKKRKSKNGSSKKTSGNKKIVK